LPYFTDHNYFIKTGIYPDLSVIPIFAFNFKKMLITTYNVNGIRSALHKGFLNWLETFNPDVVCLQETKAQPEQIPVFHFQELGYHSFWHSAEKKGYSGVAILSRQEPDHVEYGMGNPLYDTEGRVLRADFKDWSVMSVYHPSGTTGEVRQAFKMQWLEDFLQYLAHLRQKKTRLIISGDFNICHNPIDIHDPVRNAKSSGFLPEEREWMSRFLESGYTDTFRFFNNEPNHYTWWSNRPGVRAKNLGWRIDYNMVTQNLEPYIKNVGISPQVVHSDHCPAWLELKGI